MRNFSIFRPRVAKPIPPVERMLDLAGRSYRLDIRRNARAKSIALRVDTNAGAIRVTMPPYASEAQMLGFIRQKTDWIADCFDRAGPVSQMVPGDSLLWQGEVHIICWSATGRRSVKVEAGRIIVGGPQEHVPKRLLAWLKREARKALQADLAEFCAIAGEAGVPDLKLSNARRRWGSCSANGDIRINWRLIMAPSPVRRSVVAHEVAHLRHMNHSKAFYGWLDAIYDADRKAADAWLKANGARLYAVMVG